MIITTTNTLEGLEIEAYLGLISANQVVGANLIADVFASFSDVFGGNSGAYRERLDELYSQVVHQLEEKAAALGANAIIGLHIDFDEISGKGKSMFMVTALGTAVSYKSKLIVDRYEVYKKLYEIKQFLNEKLITPEEYEREAAMIRKQYDNEIEKESQRIKEREKALIKEKEIEKAKRDEAAEILKKALGEEGIADIKSLYGLKIDDVIEIKETGDCSSIDGFTPEGKILCHVNGETLTLDFNEVQLVE